MRVLITGHEGFIGRNALRILSDSFDIILYRGDIRDFKLSEKYEIPEFKLDAVLHLAALAGVRNSWFDPEEYWNVNVTGSMKVFSECERLGVRCIYASSSSIYEWWQNPYATTKKVMEEIAPKNSVGMRFHTVYGPDSRPDMFYDMMLNDKVEYLTNHKRDWTHVEDIVSAIKILLTTTHVQGKMDIGTENSVSVVDVAREYGYRDVPIREVTGERIVTQADNSQLRNLGWTPKYNIMKEVRNERIKRTVPLG